MQADYRRPTQVLEHKGLWRRCACFYRQVLIFQQEGMWRLLLSMWHKCATAFCSTFLNTSTSRNGGNEWQNLEPNEVCCFRAKNSEGRYGRRRRIGASDPNRRSFSPLANERFVGAITLKP